MTITFNRFTGVYNNYAENNAVTNKRTKSEKIPCLFDPDKCKVSCD